MEKFTYGGKMQNKNNSLSVIDILQDITSEEIKNIEDKCAWRSFAAQQQIIDRISDSKDVYFIINGTVRVVNYSLSGKEISFEDISTGALFGEISAIDGGERSANVIATSDTVVAIMPANVFTAMLAKYPNIALRIMKRLSKIIRISVDRIMDLSTLGANNRVYAELLRLAKIKNQSFDDGLKNITIAIPNHSNIASRVSTTRETVARVFGELTKNKKKKKVNNKLEIADINRLQEMVEHFRGN